MAKQDYRFNLLVKRLGAIAGSRTWQIRDHMGGTGSGCSGKTKMQSSNRRVWKVLFLVENDTTVDVLTKYGR